jgi:hypothetical protein
LVPVVSRSELTSVLRVRADCGGRVFPAKLGVVVHYLPHQQLDDLLADDAILLARQFCDCLRDRVDHFVGFTGIKFVIACCRRIVGKEIVDQFDHQAVKARAFLVALLL